MGFCYKGEQGNGEVSGKDVRSHEINVISEYKYSLVRVLCEDIEVCLQ